MTDEQRAWGLMNTLGADPQRVQVVTIEGHPASKARPRFGRGGHAYTKAESRAAEMATALFLRRAFREPFSGNVAIACLFFRPNKQRIDVDNMLKHVCDSANGILWADDSQATAVVGIVEFDEAMPRTVIAVGPHTSTMERGTSALRPCARCGKPFAAASRKRGSRYCSGVCAHERLAEPVPCDGCSTPFRRQTTTQRFCTMACAKRFLAGKPRNRSRKPASCCATCGKQLAHTRGGRCRECWRAAA